MKNATCIGMPLRPAISGLDRAAVRAEARKAFGLDPDRPTLFVTGGSQGARRLNQAMEASVGALRAAGVQVLHSYGDKNTFAVEQDPDGPPYVARPYLDRMDLAYAAADFALSRGGMMTCSEFAAVGLPAAYVPLPIGNGEQWLNARPVVDAGGGLLVDDAELTAEWLAKNVIPLLVNPERLAQMSEAALRFGIRDADDRMARLVFEAAGVAWPEGADGAGAGAGTGVDAESAADEAGDEGADALVAGTFGGAWPFTSDGPFASGSAKASDPASEADQPRSSEAEWLVTTEVADLSDLPLAPTPDAVPAELAARPDPGGSAVREAEWLVVTDPVSTTGAAQEGSVKTEVRVVDGAEIGADLDAEIGAEIDTEIDAEIKATAAAVLAVEAVEVLIPAQARPAAEVSAAGPAKPRAKKTAASVQKPDSAGLSAEPGAAAEKPVKAPARSRAKKIAEPAAEGVETAPAAPARSRAKKAVDSETGAPAKATSRPRAKKAAETVTAGAMDADTVDVSAEATVPAKAPAKPRTKKTADPAIDSVAESAPVAKAPARPRAKKAAESGPESTSSAKAPAKAPVKAPVKKAANKAAESTPAAKPPTTSRAKKTTAAPDTIIPTTIPTTAPTIPNPSQETDAR
jgi:hypothetical protein